jgi:hypothetical protein
MVDIDRYRAAERQLFAAAGIEPKEHHLDLRRVGVNARLLETGDGEPTLCPRLRPSRRRDRERRRPSAWLDDPGRAAKLMSSFLISANN